MEERRRPHSLFFPLLLIAVGIVMLLNALNMIQGSTLDILLRLWPLLFIAGGLDSLYRREGAVGDPCAHQHGNNAAPEPYAVVTVCCQTIRGVTEALNLDGGPEARRRPGSRRR